MFFVVYFLWSKDQGFTEFFVYSCDLFFVFIDTWFP